MARENGVPGTIRTALGRVWVGVDDFAEDLGLSRSTLYYWRHGRRNPTPENLVRLAEALDRRSEELREVAQELRRAAEV